MPDSCLKAGTEEGSKPAVSLSEDAWDMLGLGSSGEVSSREQELQMGQVTLLTSANFFAEKKRVESEMRLARRSQQVAKLASKDGGATGSNQVQMKEAKFKWSNAQAKSFEWRKIYHALVGNVTPEAGGIISEVLITPTAMRMYTDHRVMGQVVLPGVSHISLMAATASLGMPSPGGGMGDWHVSVKETLFERPYIVHSGADLIAAIANGVDPSTVTAMAGGLPVPMTPVGVPVTYCRASNVTKERGLIKAETEWTK
jgi:hypothetical protein